jgi:hypothetical protein
MSDGLVEAGVPDRCGPLIRVDGPDNQRVEPAGGQVQVQAGV